MLESILFKVLLAGIIFAAVVLARWIHRDATSELKNMERQKQEMLAKGEEQEGVYEMKPEDSPWLHEQPSKSDQHS